MQRYGLFLITQVLPLFFFVKDENLTFHALITRTFERHTLQIVRIICVKPLTESGFARLLAAAFLPSRQGRSPGYTL